MGAAGSRLLNSLHGSGITTIAAPIGFDYDSPAHEHCPAGMHQTPGKDSRWHAALRSPSAGPPFGFRGFLGAGASWFLLSPEIGASPKLALGLGLGPALGLALGRSWESTFSRKMGSFLYGA